MCVSYSSFFSGSTDPELSAIYNYVVAARDMVVSDPSFPITTPGSPSIRSVTITNYRNEPITLTREITSGADFAISGGTCALSVAPDRYQVPAAVAGAGNTTTPSSCTVGVQFSPAAGITTSRTGNLRIIFSDASTFTPPTRNITLNGTANVPVFSTTNFGAFASPGFTAATNGSAVTCATIANTGTASLALAFSAEQATGTSGDYSTYYEVGSLGACSGAVAAACVGPASSVTGSTSLPGGTSCTVPIRFNPGKFGFAGGEGARFAQLVVTHNSPSSGTQARQSLIGNVTLGPQPRIGITTDPTPDGSGRVLPVQFASQVLQSTSASSSIVVSNTGDADGLDITQVVNSNPTEFPMVEDCVAATPLARLNIGTGAPVCTIGLRFTPSALGQRCTSVTVRAAVSSNGDQLTLVCGNGVPVPIAQMTLAPASISFGNRAIGGTYAPLSLNIGNASGATAALQIGAIGLVGSGFALVPDASACAGRSLAAGTSCMVQVQFTPNDGTAGATYNADLTIASNDATTPNRTVSLTGTAIAAAVPQLQWQGLASNAVSFPGLVIAGQTSPTSQVLRLANPDGPGAVNLQAIRTVGVDASSFALTACPTQLPEGSFCDITVSFTPTSGGTKTAQIDLVSSNGAIPPTLTLTGMGAGGISPFVVTSGAVDFGSVRVGTRSDLVSVRIAASGDGVVTIANIVSSEPFAISSQTCPPTPFVLRVGEECLIRVSFAPTSENQSSGSLRIVNDTANTPTEVLLKGRGDATADISSGGCSISGLRSGADPVLPVLSALAVLALWLRQRGRRQRSRGQP